MKKITITIALGLIIISTNAQVQKLAGPRIGFTFITAGATADVIHKGFGYLDDESNRLGETGSAFITQYGWQWESRFADGGGNITGIVEWIALAGGMEQGKFLPSVSSIIGLRTDKGLEFGVGPNISLSGVGMVFGAGYNFRSGSLNLPVNIVFMPGVKREGKIHHSNNTTEEYTYSTGARVSLMLGFNLAK